jgi:YD repeat-containing protein
VLRGGWGRFYFHSAQFTNGLDVSAGVKNYNFPNPTTLRQIEATTPGGGDRLGAAAVDQLDDKSPYSDSYSFTIAQRLWGSLLEAAYLGNRSRDLPNNSGPGNNMNAVPGGTLLRPGVGDPNNPLGGYDSYRPINGFQDLRISTHGLYANYNSFQLTWLYVKSRYNINVNYTLGKQMGVVVPNATPGDDFNIANNYGVLPTDRRHLFNAAYSIELGNPIRNNVIAKGFLNGWQLSGITQIQSGANLTPNNPLYNNFSLGTGGATLANGYNISARSINGTDSIQLRPLITCDPTSGLKENQYMNGSCFALPTTPGVNGPTMPPAIYGPMFLNNDLGLFKNFNISEHKKLQFRFNAYNFLNHPLTSFLVSSNNLKLTYDAAGKLANPNFGMATEKQGHRIIQLALKFYF